MIKVVPEVNGDYTHNRQNVVSSRSLSLQMSKVAVGIRGTIGEKLEFALIPSINSNVFMTGLDVKYLFTGVKNKENIANR